MSTTSSRESPTKLYNPALELAKWLTTQTARRQLIWERQGSLLSAKLRDATTTQFLIYSESPRSQAWNQFTVHDASGRKLLRATPDATCSNDSPLLVAIDALFKAIAECSSAMSETQPAPSVFVSTCPSAIRFACSAMPRVPKGIVTFRSSSGNSFKVTV